jgi:hypothetical protein
MANPKILRAVVDVQSLTLTVTVERDVTDAMTGITTRTQYDIGGPLASLAGIPALRTNVLAWVKAQTGYAGTIDSA